MAVGKNRCRLKNEHLLLQSSTITKRETIADLMKSMYYFMIYPYRILQEKRSSFRDLNSRNRAWNWPFRNGAIGCPRLCGLYFFTGLASIPFCRKTFLERKSFDKTFSFSLFSSLFHTIAFLQHTFSQHHMHIVRMTHPYDFGRQEMLFFNMREIIQLLNVE